MGRARVGLTFSVAAGTLRSSPGQEKNQPASQLHGGTIPITIMNDEKPILYVKQGCPYCVEAIEYFEEHQIAYEQKEVLSDRAAFDEMKRKSGQSKAPTLDWHGEILADFGVEELHDFLQSRNAKLEGR